MAAATHVLLFYKYVDLGDEVEAHAAWLETLCGELRLTGRALIAPEGINSNLAGDCASVDAFIAAMETRGGGDLFGGIDWKREQIAADAQKPFPDLAVKRVEEIISTVSPRGKIPASLLAAGLGGVHLSPEDFHAELDCYLAAPEGSEAQRNTVLIDVRNRKEFNLGHFKGAVDPDTKNFTQFAPRYVDPRLDELRGKKILMYCTGGIRCEKASAYLRSQGCDDVSQLSGGIQRYLERYGTGGHFEGNNFVFDARGQQRLPGAAVVGRCVGCGAGEDRQSGDRVCAVCRDAVLVCDGCRRALRGVYFCRDHSYLAHGAYEPFLARFAADELRRQLARLQALMAAGGAVAGKANKNRRRAVLKQARRVEVRVAAVEGGEAVDGDAPVRCRSCGRPSRFFLEAGAGGAGMPKVEELCDGRCWGFFQEERRQEGYVDLDSAVAAAEGEQ
jgi:UPF0176 protein